MLPPAMAVIMVVTIEVTMVAGGIMVDATMAGGIGDGSYHIIRSINVRLASITIHTCTIHTCILTTVSL